MSLPSRFIALAKRGDLPEIMVIGVFAAAITWFIATQPGVPAFQQDWIWPINRSQLAPFLTATFYAWNPNGFGQPLVYPEPWLPTLAAAGLCYLAGVRIGLLLYLASMLVVGGLGMRRLLKPMATSRFARCAAIAAFMGSPVMLNELQAGHTYFFLSYAFLPWIAARSLSYKRPVDALWLGVLIGIGSAQQQFFIFNLALAAACIFRRGAKPVVGWFIALGAALVTVAPQWILLATQGQASLNVFVPLRHWEFAQSTGFSEAVRALGYTGGYDTTLLPWAVRAAWWIIPIVALYAVVTARTFSERWIFAGCAVVGVFMTNGLDGALSIPLQYAFDHLKAFALFRELYNFAALTGFGYAVLVAIALGQRNIQASTLNLYRVFAIGIIFVAFATAVRSSVAIPRASPALAEMFSKTAPQGYRYLPVPASFPQSPSRVARGGLSPFLMGYGTQPSGASPAADYPEMYIARLADSGSSQLAVAARRAGIGSIVPIPGVYEDARSVIEPSLRGLLPIPKMPIASRMKSVGGAERLVVEPFSSSPGTLATRYVGARDLRPVVSHRFVDPNLLGASPDPRRDWARTALWTTLPTWMYAMQSGAFTLRSAALLHVPASTIIVGTKNGSVTARGCTLVEHLDAHWSTLRCASHPTLVGMPPIAISEIAVNATIPPSSGMSGAFGSAVILASTPTRIRANVRATPGSAIVLRDSYSPGWEISISNAHHVALDGLGNGWILPSGYNGVVTIWYAPESEHLLAIVASALIVMMAGIAEIRRVSIRQRSALSGRHPLMPNAS